MATQSTPVPVLFPRGEYDLTAAETGRAADATIPGATVGAVDGAGPVRFHDAPDRTAERISRGLRDTSDHADDLEEVV